ncbi:MAG: carotenoid biosynthesis protein [Chlamydiae bacterium]|nr:carotenoid biosynthesis protein [Chlamydiota bacterium]
MFKKTKPLNIWAITLLAIGFIAHIALPKHLLIADSLFFAAAALHSYMIWGGKRTASYLILAMIIGYSAEFIGINTGLVFGSYYYNPENPLMIFGVPLFIPVAYGYLIYSGNLLLVAISKRFLKKSNLWLLAILSGFILTLKDVVTDPIHSTIQSEWIWRMGGAYFGVPIHNFIGWFFVFTIMTFVTVSLCWHLKGRSTKIKIDKTLLLFPSLLFSTIIFLGFLSCFDQPEKYKDIASVGAFISIFALGPYMLLAWFNSFKKES